MLLPALWKCEMKRQPKGGGWRWRDLQKYKYLCLHFPISFPSPKVTIYCINLTRGEQGAVLSGRPWGEELSMPAPAQAGRDTGEWAISLTNHLATKRLPQPTQSNHLVHALLQTQAKEEVVTMEHAMPTPRASSCLSWKLSTESRWQGDLGNAGSLRPTALSILGTSASFPRANKSRNITIYSNFQIDLHL